jgi:hypothetical protein
LAVIKTSLLSPAAARLTASLFVLVTAGARVAAAQPQAPASEAADHTVVIELGWVGEWSRQEGLHPNGATFAFEVTPIEHWLELEIGVSTVRADGATEIPIDVLFKKPWQVSPRFEFMIGVGPELIHATGIDHDTFWGLSAVLDFMVWPRKNIGWYVEPGYELTFRDGAKHHGLAIAAGLLIGR